MPLILDSTHVEEVSFREVLGRGSFESSSGSVFFPSSFNGLLAEELTAQQSLSSSSEMSMDIDTNTAESQCFSGQT